SDVFPNIPLLKSEPVALPPPAMSVAGKFRLVVVLSSPLVVELPELPASALLANELLFAAAARVAASCRAKPAVPRRAELEKGVLSRPARVLWLKWAIRAVIPTAAGTSRDSRPSPVGRKRRCVLMVDSSSSRSAGTFLIRGLRTRRDPAA